jgi:N-methylhydantoinase B/oxoprolinase/acetone carboxylase alpha subunit
MSVLNGIKLKLLKFIRAITILNRYWFCGPARGGYTPKVESAQPSPHAGQILSIIVTLHAQAITAGKGPCSAVYVGEEENKELKRAASVWATYKTSACNEPGRSTIDGLNVYEVDAKNYLRVC